MKLTFYLQYFSYDDEKFQVDDNYYQDSNDYIKQLEDSYNSTKDTIFEMMLNGNYNVQNSFKMSVGVTNQKKDNFSYAKCEGYLLNENMEEEDIDSLLNYHATEDIVVSFMRLDSETMEEEFETNWAMFLDSTKKINEYPADADWKHLHKPTKDIFFSLTNKKGEIVYGKLVNCRLEEINNLYSNVLIIEKVVFIKKLE